MKTCPNAISLKGVSYIFLIDGLQGLHTAQYSKFLWQFWSKVLPKRR